jgi:hypothetical protein
MNNLFIDNPGYRKDLRAFLQREGAASKHRWSLKFEDLDTGRKFHVCKKCGCQRERVKNKHYYSLLGKQFDCAIVCDVAFALINEGEGLPDWDQIRLPGDEDIDF